MSGLLPAPRSSVSCARGEAAIVLRQPLTSLSGMSSGAEHLSPGLHAYLVAHSTTPDALLLDLIAETAERFPADVTYQIGAEQGTFMTMLASLMGARQAVEVGTFTGYSSICLARGYWQRAGLSDRIELRLAPAVDTLRALPAGPWLDLAFIDADKPGYTSYWEELVPRVRPGGVILVDNTFLHGRIFERQPDESAQAIKDFNEHALADARTEVVMLPVGDGLTIARKR